MKKTISLCLVFFISVSLFSFEWPLAIEKGSLQVSVNFAENRKNVYSTGFVFSQDGNVLASDDGELLFTMNSDDSYYDSFNSTLGNTIIIAHNDQMISVYSNLNTISDLTNKTSFVKSDVIAQVDKTKKDSNAWHNESSTLEFQIIDIKNNVIINPYLLLPLQDHTNPVFPGNITLINKKGVVYKLDEVKTLPAGFYSVYRSTQISRMPLKTTVSVNGLIVYAIDYDTLMQDKERLCAVGNQNIPFEKMYLDSKTQFLADINLSRGKNILCITVTDSFKTERKAYYTIESR